MDVLGEVNNYQPLNITSLLHAMLQSVSPHLPVPCDHLITQNGPQDGLHLEAGLHQAASCSYHTCCQGATDSDSTQILYDVGCQSEWYRAVGIQVTCITCIEICVMSIPTSSANLSIPTLQALNTIKEADNLHSHSKRKYIIFILLLSSPTCNFT